MILVTGGTGMLGKALQNHLSGMYIGSSDYDLRNQNEAQKCLEFYCPDTVVHLAARVGGIIANSKYIYGFFYDNIMINTNVLDACLKNNVKSVIAILSSCVYPSESVSCPMTEGMLHCGPPHETNAGYAYAKRMIQVQLSCATKQYGTEWCILYPTNMYGLHDNFGEECHVIPALIKRFHKAKIDNSAAVECYGTGRPMRQFVYSEDLAKVITRSVNENLTGEYNVCDLKSYSIREVTEIISETVGYSGEIRWNGKLDGVHRKDLDSSKIQNKFDIEYISLRDGIENVYKWFAAQ